MSDKNKFFLFNSLIALVWLGNGLFCKVLNLVPRHQEIVGRILNTESASLFTKLIGLGEILIFLCVALALKPRKMAVLQITLVLLMNSIEFILVPDLLLWGRFNALFALLFCLLVYYNAFRIYPSNSKFTHK